MNWCGGPVVCICPPYGCFLKKMWITNPVQTCGSRSHKDFAAFISYFLIWKKILYEILKSTRTEKWIDQQLCSRVQVSQPGYYRHGVPWFKKSPKKYRKRYGEVIWLHVILVSSFSLYNNKYSFFCEGGHRWEAQSLNLIKKNALCVEVASGLN